MVVAESNHGTLAAARRFRRTRMLLGLIVAAMALSMSVTAKAEAACMDLDDCWNIGAWHQAAAGNHFNKGLWFQAAARSDFENAANWNNRAGLYFIAGDAPAAAWAKATATHYSDSAVRNARAADDSFTQATYSGKFSEINFMRYVFFGNLEDNGDDGVVASAAARKIGTGSLKKAKAICNKHWAGRIACSSVVSEIVGRAKRYVWKMLGGSVCLRQKTNYDVNPSTGNARPYHVCVKWR